MTKKTMTIGLLLIAAPLLSFALSASRPLAATEPPSPWVQHSTMLNANDVPGLAFDCLATLTEAYVRDVTPPASVRILTVSVGVVWNHVLLDHRLDVKGVATSSSDPFSMVVGDVNLANGTQFAKQALGQGGPPDKPSYSPRYVINLEPTPGLDWSQVDSADDLSFSITPWEPLSK